MISSLENKELYCTLGACPSSRFLLRTGTDSFHMLLELHDLNLKTYVSSYLASRQSLTLI